MTATDSAIMDLIRARAITLGMTQADICRAMPCDPRHLTRWWRGHTTPNIRHLERIMEVLGLVVTGKENV